MWNLFKRKPLLPDEDYQFQMDCFRWLLKYFGGDDFYKDTSLILPTKEFFPDTVDSRQELVQFSFDLVKEYAGMKLKFPEYFF